VWQVKGKGFERQPSEGLCLACAQESLMSLDRRIFKDELIENDKRSPALNEMP
jgi:hypothetical protein